jgi:hypothetical protein
VPGFCQLPHRGQESAVSLFSVQGPGDGILAGHVSATGSAWVEGFVEPAATQPCCCALCRRAVSAFGCHVIEGHQGTMMPIIIDNDEGVMREVSPFRNGVVP